MTENGEIPVWWEKIMSDIKRKSLTIHTKQMVFEYNEK